jgi:ribosomal protein S18 acetylase RimI-like enzyme
MALTLPQVPDRVHVDGTWPGAVTIRRGWSRAQARPWNDEGPEAAVRLVRGSSDFLRASAGALRDLGAVEVYSPALYPNATRVWDDAGFSRFRELTVMERVLDQTIEEPGHRVGLARTPDWQALAGVDRECFTGFWRMSALGLAEAMHATPRSALFQIDDGPGLIGYAIVGAQFTTSYLQRVAVLPERGSGGLGTALIRGCLLWARARGARSMVLNVRPENERAARIYRREGFTDTGVALQVLRFDP